VGNLGEALENRVRLENTIAYLVRELYPDNGIAFLVGALSSVTSEAQLQSLMERLLQEAEKDIN